MRGWRSKSRSRGRGARRRRAHLGFGAGTANKVGFREKELFWEQVKEKEQLSLKDRRTRSGVFLRRSRTGVEAEAGAQARARAGAGSGAGWWKEAGKRRRNY